MAHFEGVNGGEESSSRLSGSPGHASTSLWRSEEMQFVQLVIPAEAAHDTVARLGHVGLMQFKDLNTDKSAFQRTYANQVKRCDEMQRKLRFLLDEMVKVGIADADAKLQAVTHALADPELLESSYELDELEVSGTRRHCPIFSSSRSFLRTQEHAHACFLPFPATFVKTLCCFLSSFPFCNWSGN